MEEDDEFGDLYTDVLKPFSLPSTTTTTPSLSSASQPHQPSPAPSPLSRPIDLNLHIKDSADSLRNSAALTESNQTLVPNSTEIDKPDKDSARDVETIDKDVKFDIEDDVGGEPVIPGLSSGGGGGGTGAEFGVSERNDVEEDDDWDDSDSEDDLKIVLNDDNHGPMGMERGGIGVEDDDDDDEDGDPLVIVADNEPNQAMEEQEWGEDAGQTGDGERKEGDAAKAGSGVGVAPKMGYAGHGYHPYSQFKYVRPGAAPIPGSAPAGSGVAPGQVRPLVNMGPIAGRGRGDWRATGIRPPMQKGFHPGYGAPSWGAGRGFGGGLDFTLPSHKTIFDVDIDSFEEKPWKYPGVDISDFFNFGLNEESWKDYCKQLEQQRLESTMQSRIRVIDSGRTEQEYDPDMPPELAAATGVLDITAENANLGRSDVGQNEQVKGSARVRPPFPTGRAIQVESGYGERLPSIDTRPPRIRDPDTVIEIVCQDNLDDNSSTGNGVECPDNSLARDDNCGDHVPEEDVPVEDEILDTPHEEYNSKGRRQENKIRANPDNSMPDVGGISAGPLEAPDQYDPASRGQSGGYSGRKHCPTHERPTGGRRVERSPHFSPSQDTNDANNEKEEPVESMENKRSPSSSPVTSAAVQESSADQKVAADDEPVAADEDSDMEKVETLDVRAMNDSTNGMTWSQKKHKMTSQARQESDDGEDSKAARSSENSKARSGSSREYQKRRDSTEEEVIQDGHTKRMGSVRRHIENDERVRRKDRDGRPEMERSHMTGRARENFYSRELDRSSVHHLPMSSDGFDRRKERDIIDGSLHQTDDDYQSRRIRNEDARKRERAEELVSRHRGKVREGERTYKEEHSLSRKQLDNGLYRAHYDKDIGSRQRERDDILRGRYENMDDYHSKKRRDEEYVRRDHIDREETWHVHRENISHRKRERDNIVDQWKRDEQQRFRENIDEHHSVRHKDDGWFLRDRGDRRERDEWHKLKQAHDENILKREKEEGRATMRTGRGVDDKAWGNYSRMKDEYKSSDRSYQIKDTVRHSEHYRGREDSYTRGSHINNEEKRFRQDRSIPRNDNTLEAFDDQRGREKRHKENVRKTKEPQSGDCNASSRSKKYSEDQSVSETVKGTGEQGNCVREGTVHHHSSKRQREDASSDDEHQDTKKGRSKLERWTSHKERDFSINSKSSSSLKFKQIDVNGTSGSLESTKVAGESAKSVEAVGKENPSTGAKDASDLQSKDADEKKTEDKHLDTVEKLKKRSERFKLPMPIEKDASAVKKIESEPLPSAKSEAPAETEIKQGRPPRKRRWTGNSS